MIISRCIFLKYHNFTLFNIEKYPFVFTSSIFLSISLWVDTLVCSITSSLHLYKLTVLVMGAGGGQKRALKPLEPDLEVVENCHVGTEAKFRSSARATDTRKCRVVFQPPSAVFLRSLKWQQWMTWIEDLYNETVVPGELNMLRGGSKR